MMGAMEGTRVTGVGSSGTDHALAAVYRSHYGALVGTARLLLDDRRSAEEVVQEAFARTWAAFDRLRDPGDPLPYVRRAVVNLARSGLRRRRTVRMTPLQAVPDAVAADVTFANAEARRELAGAVRALPAGNASASCSATTSTARPRKRWSRTETPGADAATTAWSLQEANGQPIMYNVVALLRTGVSRLRRRDGDHDMEELPTDAGLERRSGDRRRWHLALLHPPVTASAASSLRASKPGVGPSSRSSG